MVVPVSASMPDSNLTPTQVQRKFASSSLAGLGEDSVDLCSLYPESCATAPPQTYGTEDLCALYPAACQGGVMSTGGGPYAGSGSSIYLPTSGSTDWTSIINNLARAGVDVSKLALIQPGTTLTAGGAISRQNPGYAIPGTNTASLGLNAGGGSTTLLLLGVAAIAMFMMSKK